ncbi:hypothetical protein [Roseicitreum antarcticum]|uniref:MarR family protein n=1 Tax=Roseicitreum antarcticum TaxID=564137 RepID=A0A1H3B2Q9_9RHOB|nr:hypothetical protein [Roseicitreum antarcticum]SDX36212.1 hypothetical protein SAMN04488238_107230 [Roseicitreum antarcticum]
MDHEEIPLHWINRLGFLVRRALGDQFRAAGHPVSPEEWAILLVLWKYGPRTPGALADVTIKDRTTIICHDRERRPPLPAHWSMR